MTYDELEQHLRISSDGNKYRLPNEISLKVQRASYHEVLDLGIKETKQLAVSYLHIESLLHKASNSVMVLADENRRLQAENEFMLKLIDKYMTE